MDPATRLQQAATFVMSGGSTMSEYVQITMITSATVAFLAALYVLYSVFDRGFTVVNSVSSIFTGTFGTIRALCSNDWHRARHAVPYLHAIITFVAILGGNYWIVGVMWIGSLWQLWNSRQTRLPLVVISPWHNVDGARAAHMHGVPEYLARLGRKIIEHPSSWWYAFVAVYTVVVMGYAYASAVDCGPNCPCEPFEELLQAAGHSPVCGRVPIVMLAGPFSAGKTTILSAMAQPPGLGDRSELVYPEEDIGKQPTTDFAYCVGRWKKTGVTCPRHDGDLLIRRESNLTFFRDYTVLDTPGMKQSRVSDSDYTHQMVSLAQKSDLLLLVFAVGGMDIEGPGCTLLKAMTAAAVDSLIPLLVVLNMCDSGTNDCNSAIGDLGGVTNKCFTAKHENTRPFLLPVAKGEGEAHKMEKFRKEVMSTVVRRTENRVETLRRDMIPRARQLLKEATFPWSMWRIAYEYRRSRLLAKRQ